MQHPFCLVSLAIVAAPLIAGCSGVVGETSATDRGVGSPSTATTTTSVAASENLGEVSLPVADGADVNGLVNVRGHDLAVHCTGSGSPTVVILHGWIEQPGITSHDYYGPLTRKLKPDFRVCSYDRANVGDSEAVGGRDSGHGRRRPRRADGGHRRPRTLRARRPIRGWHGCLRIRRRAPRQGRRHRDGRREFRRGNHPRGRRHGARRRRPLRSGEPQGRRRSSPCRRSTTAPCTSGLTSAATNGPRSHSCTWRPSRRRGASSPNSGLSTPKRSSRCRSPMPPAGPREGSSGSTPATKSTSNSPAS